MAKTIAPGIYVFKYRIGGVFEILSVSRGDILEAYNKTINAFSNVEPVKDRVVFDKSSMTANVYIRVKRPLDVNKWNNRFLNNLRNVFSALQRYGQWLSFEYVSHEKSEKSEAEHEGLISSFTSEIASPFGNWMLWAIPIGIVAYVASTQIVESTISGGNQ